MKKAGLLVISCLFLIGLVIPVEDAGNQVLSDNSGRW